jgi:hypothetical protein
MKALQALPDGIQLKNFVFIGFSESGGRQSVGIAAKDSVITTTACRFNNHTHSANRG